MGIGCVSDSSLPLQNFQAKAGLPSGHGIVVHLKPLRVILISTAKGTSRRTGHEFVIVFQVAPRVVRLCLSECLGYSGMACCTDLMVSLRAASFFAWLSSSLPQFVCVPCIRIIARSRLYIAFFAESLGSDVADKWVATVEDRVFLDCELSGALPKAQSRGGGGDNPCF